MIRSQLSKAFAQRMCVFCVALLVLEGCGSVSMQSVRDPSFSDPVHNLFVIINHSQLDTVDPAYTPYLVTALKEELTAKGVEMEIRVVNALTLDENVSAAEIASYKPDGVLTIVATGGVVGQYGGALRIAYDVSLYDTAKHKRIWRARLQASGGPNVQEKRMRMLAQDLVKRLDEEKLISSEPRKTGQAL